MSMPSPPLRVSFLDHSCSPVAALSANALSAVAPYTLPPTTLTPFGTVVGRVVLGVPEQLAGAHLDRVHARVQVLEVGDAADDDRRRSRSCRTMPALPVIGTFQATPSLETLDELIDDCTSRVPARLPLGCVQLAAAAAGRRRRAGDDVVVAWVVARWSTSSSSPRTTRTSSTTMMTSWNSRRSRRAARRRRRARRARPRPVARSIDPRL